MINPQVGTVDDDITIAATSLTNASSANDQQAVGAARSYDHHPPDITLPTLRYARANGPTFSDRKTPSVLLPCRPL
ncbi:hypothetical protein ACQEU8_00225 [Streptomyces sp. CA-250714]|uniref:hypothetical protein n=1 Tax=Streptomyces sp. CA-250714 TaxID=3240060 RepID=UPI003D927402